MKVTKKQIESIIKEAFEDAEIEEAEESSRASIVADISEQFDIELQNIKLDPDEIRDISRDMSGHLEDLIRAYKLLIDYNSIDRNVAIALKPLLSDSESDREAKRSTIDAKLAELIEEKIAELTN